MSNNDAETSSKVINGIGDQFMMVHFSEMNQDFRHYDQRVETALNIYAAVWALLITGVVGLYGGTKDLQLLLRVAGVPSIILLILGFFTVRRVVNSTISRDRRRAAANLTQHYFTLQAPEISPYLVTLGRTPKRLKSVLQEPERRGEKYNYEVSFPNRIVHFIIVLSSFIAGLAVISVASWLPQAEGFWLLFLYVLVTVVTLAERLFAYQKRKKQYLQKK